MKEVPISDYRSMLDKHTVRNEARPTPTLLKSKVRFTVNQNFTIAVIIANGKTNRILGVGASKRNPIDSENENVGKIIALWRALDEFYGIW